MVSKEILSQYCDLQDEIKEVREKIRKIEADIEKIEIEGTVKDKVKGGEGGWESFNIEGFPYPEYTKKRRILCKRKNNLKDLEDKLLETLSEVEVFISQIPDSYMRRIINYRFVDNLTWREVAIRMGSGYTDEAIRKSFYRFMENS